jgi:hypothetical protein
MENIKEISAKDVNEALQMAAKARAEREEMESTCPTEQDKIRYSSAYFAKKK